MISIIFGIILTIGLTIFSLFLYLFIGFIIFEVLDRHAWFDHIDIYDRDRKEVAIFIWPIIIVLAIIQLIVYIVFNTIPFIIFLFKDIKELLREIKYMSWLAGSLICEIWVKIFSRKK